MGTRCRLDSANQILWSYVLHKRESKPLLPQILQGSTNMIKPVIDDQKSVVSLVECLDINGRILGIVPVDIQLELRRNLLGVDCSLHGRYPDTQQIKSYQDCSTLWDDGRILHFVHSGSGYSGIRLHSLYNRKANSPSTKTITAARINGGNMSPTAKERIGITMDNTR